MADENNATNIPSTPPEPEHFSRDYVEALRGDVARYRTRAKAAEKVEAGARKAFGLEPDDDIGDLAARLTAHEAKALEKANTRLVAAEIRALPGYDTALLEKIIDRSGIAVGDDGTVTGVKEAAEAAAKQFPAVAKTQQDREQWAPKNPAAGEGGANENQAMNDLIRRK